MTTGIGANGRYDDWAGLPPAPDSVAAPPPGECHLWPVPVLAPGADQTGWLALLDAPERERAERYVAEHARRVFITSRAAQRLVPARYTGQRADQVRIERDCRRCGHADHGRPRVRGAGALDLSVTHAGDWVLLAVVGAGAVGVDLEPYERTRTAVDELAGAVFSPDERAEFDALPAAERTRCFYRSWTRKEAAAKLTGHGLALPLRSLDVRAERATAAPPPAGWPAGGVWLTDVPAPSGYAAALATTVETRRLRGFTVAPAGQRP